MESPNVENYLPWAFDAWFTKATGNRPNMGVPETYKARRHLGNITRVFIRGNSIKLALDEITPENVALAMGAMVTVPDGKEKVEDWKGASAAGLLELIGVNTDGPTISFFLYVYFNKGELVFPSGDLAFIELEGSFRRTADGQLSAVTFD